MLSSYIILVVSAVFFISPTYGSKYNVSYSDLVTCSEYTIDSRGYSYPDFFHVNSFNNSKSNNAEVLHLKLYVLTSMDAHILLTERNKLKRDERVYEIVLGAGANTFSAIRLKLSRERVALKTSPNLLSVLDPMPLEIILTKDGTLSVNIPGLANPFMKYIDPSPLNITYISFSSYSLTKAKWFYDCAFDGYAEEMQLEEKPVTNEERLIADILSTSDPQFPPPNVNQITLSFKVRSVEYDQLASLLHTRMHLFLNWTDSRLAWNPKDYEGANAISQPMFKVWRPELSIAEGAMSTFEKFDPFYSIQVDNTGFVQMSARNAEFHSWCFAASKNWPNDITRCNLTLEVRDNGIKLVYDTKSPLASKSVNELSEWKINQVKVSFTTEDNKVVEDDSNSGNALYSQLIEEGLFIQLTISRNSEFYKCAFLVPVLVAEGLLLLAFFLEEHRRGGMNLVAFIVLCIGFMILVLHAPKGVISHIVLLYDSVMKISIVTYMLHIASIWLELYPPKMKPHRCVLSVINCSALRYALAMRLQDSSDYITSLEYPWRDVSRIVNRIMFISLLITFALII